MPITSEQLEILKNEIGIWAEKNFKVHLPALGVLEEIGEAAHCVLKYSQGIRGFESRDYFLEQLTDAIADAGIYLLHCAYLGGLNLMGFDPIQPNYDSKLEMEDSARADRSRAIFCDLAEIASTLLATEKLSPRKFRSTASSLMDLGGLYDIDAWKAVNKVWNEKVSKRDWKENPEHAAAVQEAEENKPFIAPENPS